MAARGAIFSPWDGLDLSYTQDNMLNKVGANVVHGERTQTPLAHTSLLFDASDDEIWDCIINGKPIVREQPEPEPVAEKKSVTTATTRKSKK
jgi:hypothetical protein